MSQTEHPAGRRPSREERADLVYRYFMAVPRPPVRPDRMVPVLTMVAAVLPLFLGLSLIRFGLGTALVPLGIAATMAAYGYNELSKGERRWRQDQEAYQAALAAYGGKPSGAQMDAWLTESVDDVKREGLRRLDLTPDQLSGARPGAVGSEPLEVLGLPDRGQRVYYVRDDHDGQVRFSSYAITVIYLTEWKLCAFQCRIDMATGAIQGESTREFHYQHINTVTTESDRVALPGETHPLGYLRSDSTDTWLQDPNGYAVHVTNKQTLMIGVAGDRLSLTVGIFDEQQFGTSDPTMTKMRSRADQTIQQVRQQLHYHNRRGGGGIGSLDEEDPLGP